MGYNKEGFAKGDWSLVASGSRRICVGQRVTERYCMAEGRHHGNHAERTAAPADSGGAARVDEDHEGEQRAAGSGTAGDGAAGGRAGAGLPAGRAGGWLAERDDGRQPGAAVQSGRAGCPADRGRAWSAIDVRYGGAGPDRGDGPTAAGSSHGWDRDLVAEDAGADVAAGRAPTPGGDDDSAHLAGGGEFVSTDADLVPDGHGAAQAQGRGGAGGRSEDRRKKGAIDQAYRLAEAAGLPVWCQDEAGPYQAIPQPGVSWAPVGRPPRQPHEYVRGGTAKLLTLLRPATGEVRAKAVEQSTNAVLHPWLKRELEAILKQCPPAPEVVPEGRRWQDWDIYPAAEQLDRFFPPVRVLLILDNLAGHKSSSLVQWCAEHGILLLWTPTAGSWLNMAESLQRIIQRRALSGQHPADAQTLMIWLTDAVEGWNRHPTPFIWV